MSFGCGRRREADLLGIEGERYWWGPSRGVTLFDGDGEEKKCEGRSRSKIKSKSKSKICLLAEAEDFEERGAGGADDEGEDPAEVLEAEFPAEAEDEGCDEEDEEGFAEDAMEGT